MTNKEKMNKGMLYFPGDKEIMSIQQKCMEKLYEYNNSRPSETAKREELLKEMFGKIGENCYIEPPFHANFGGAHCFFGDYVYANFNLTCVDDEEIHIGDYTMIAPNVTITTGSHPILPELRKKGLQYNLPVYIGKNCWIGAGVVILSGITIGDNTVIGAGSVVTKNIPNDVVAYGVPCKVIRKINEHDKEYYHNDRKISKEDFDD